MFREKTRALRKKQKIVEQRKEDYFHTQNGELAVSIYGCEGIDQNNCDPYASYYSIIFSVAPEIDNWTRAVKGSRYKGPEWNRIWLMPLQVLRRYGVKLGSNGTLLNVVLNLEVIRLTTDKNDVGTSTGMKVVGRAQIPFSLRSFGIKIQQRVGLARLDETGFVTDGGYIDVALELRKSQINNYRKIHY
ncbi:hypothetical protein FNV43_RR24618 [Rhamnella rubrinervis]|uniref:C2 domain-containing protein n=1 Tax=Rhamnella rubrinervis TaxID=2594499 RepID=A0A8K0DRJ2_9ROSA|nr:hypothetical protein FNV43_RR24618 [Rhamnella rubrinervis]